MGTHIDIAAGATDPQELQVSTNGRADDPLLQVFFEQDSSQGLILLHGSPQGQGFLDEKARGGGQYGVGRGLVRE